MVNDKIIQKFISDLGTLTCSEADAFNYYLSYGVNPIEYLEELQSVPNIHFVNEKIWMEK